MIDDRAIVMFGLWLEWKNDHHLCFLSRIFFFIHTVRAHSDIYIINRPLDAQKKIYIHLVIPKLDSVLTPPPQPPFESSYRRL